MINRDIVKKIKNNPPLSMFIFYVLFDSLFLPTSIGFISIGVLMVYGMVSRKRAFQFRSSFISALVLILLAIVVNSVSDSIELNFVVKKLSDWAYVVIVLGLVQLLLYMKSGKSDSKSER